MFYDAIENRHGLRHDPFKALVAPRPIGWISSISAGGAVNLAPYSFFNAVSENPHILMFSSTGRKDSLGNIEETGEFVWNLATFPLREKMNLTSARVPHHVNEFELAGLTEAPSHMVKPPRVGESPAALECKLLRVVQLNDLSGELIEHYLVLGQVVGVYIDDGYIHEGVIDATELQSLARLGYRDYAVVDNVFQMTRPKADAFTS